MFDIGWSELVVIGVVALIAIGPKELPTVLRTCGQWMGKIRRMASEFQGQFQEAMREAEMADIKKHVDDIADTASNFSSNFDPIGSVRKEIESITADTPPAPPIEAPPAEPEVARAVEPPPAVEVATAEPAPPPTIPPATSKPGEGA